MILWDLAEHPAQSALRRHPRFKVNQTPRGIAVSPNGRTLAFTHSDGTVDLLDTRTLQRRARIQALDDYAASVAFSPDGRLLAVTGKGGRVTLWNPQTLAPAGELEGMRNVSQALAFSPDGKRLAGVEAIASEETLSGKPRPLRVWDLRSARSPISAPRPPPTCSPTAPTAGCSPPLRRSEAPRSATRAQAG